MSNIPLAIPQQKFELIRDRIGLILADELPNQSTLNSDDQLNAPVYVERFVPFSDTDMPCINVLYSGSNFDSKTVMNADGVDTYFVDVYTKGKGSEDQRGDNLAASRLHRLMGVCRAILENPIYKTLGFNPPSLSGVAVKSISVQDPQNNQDAKNVIMGRLVFEVRALEVQQLIDSTLISEAVTKIKLNESEKGYIYQSN